MDVPLPPDSGDFVHQNEHRMKKPTLLPLIKAVQDLIDQGVTPKFDWSSVDFVTDRARLRMLLAWARGKSGTDRWRIDTEFVGTKTVLLSDGAPNMKRVGGGGASYGVIFEKESTRPVPGLGNALSHYRIVTYVRDSDLVPNVLILNVVRTLMALKWLFVSRSTPASSMKPAPRVGTVGRRKRPLVHPLTFLA